MKLSVGESGRKGFTLATLGGAPFLSGIRRPGDRGSRQVDFCRACKWFLPTRFSPLLAARQATEAVLGTNSPEKSPAAAGVPKFFKMGGWKIGLTRLPDLDILRAPPPIEPHRCRPHREVRLDDTGFAEPDIKCIGR